MTAATTEARFVAWLKAARIEAGISQQKVADFLKAQGFSVFRQSTVGKIESGKRPVLLAEAVAMADLFGTTLDAALGLKPGGPQSMASQTLAHRTAALQLIQQLVNAELDGES